jgi:hypothetical protein
MATQARRYACGITNAEGDAVSDDVRRAQRRPRWGLRALGFLTLALVAVLSWDALRANGLALIGFLGVMVGLVGATVCSVRGLRQSSWLGR